MTRAPRFILFDSHSSRPTTYGKGRRYSSRPLIGDPQLHQKIRNAKYTRPISVVLGHDLWSAQVSTRICPIFSLCVTRLFADAFSSYFSC